jgi:predicted small metal-binding protein
MSKELKCGDLMPGCKAVLDGKDEAEVMARATEHARSAHGVSEVTPDLANKVRSAIKEKAAAR